MPPRAFAAAARDFKGLKSFKDPVGLKEFLGGFLQPGDVVLLKASHGMHLADALDFIPPAAPNP